MFWKFKKQKRGACSDTCILIYIVGKGKAPAIPFWHKLRVSAPVATPGSTEYV